MVCAAKSLNKRLTLRMKIRKERTFLLEVEKSASFLSVLVAL
jgi:hypothetical protein